MKIIFAFLPEIVLTFLAFLILFLEICGLAKKKVCFTIASVGLILLIPCVWMSQDFLGNYLKGAFLLDNYAIFFKFLFVVLIFMVVLLGADFMEERTNYIAEYYFLLLMSAVGLMFMVSATDLMTLFIAFELSSIPMYVLAAYFKKEKTSTEAGIKYFLLGAFSAGLMVYGISLIYGTFGTLSYKALGSIFLVGNISPAILLAMVAIIVGLGFKIAAAPFHMWAPDVYEGAPTPVVSFISVAPKAAGLAVIARFFITSFAGISYQWIFLLLLISAISMLVGNLTALPQKNFKRMLAYSGISHIGYILLGIAASSQIGLTAVLFYITIYTLTNLGAFGVLIMVSRYTKSDEIKDLAGLSRRSPGLALILLLALLSLAGIPPLGGFLAKFILFFAVFKEANPVFQAMVLFAIINSVISLYYYLKVLRAVYFEKPQSEEPITVPAYSAPALYLSVIGIVVLAMMPSFYSWISQMAKLSIFSL